MLEGTCRICATKFPPGPSPAAMSGQWIHGAMKKNPVDPKHTIIKAIVDLIPSCESVARMSSLPIMVAINGSSIAASTQATFASQSCPESSNRLWCSCNEG